MHACALLGHEALVEPPRHTLSSQGQRIPSALFFSAEEETSKLGEKQANTSAPSLTAFQSKLSREKATSVILNSVCDDFM